MRRVTAVITATMAILILATAPVVACGGLIGPNGAVRLLRTTTFAGYHDGVEHYVSAFGYVGDGATFGSIIPLPGVPSDVEGVDWTLQRLVLETSPELELASCHGRVRGRRCRSPARDAHRRPRHHRPQGRRSGRR